MQDGGFGIAGNRTDEIACFQYYDVVSLPDHKVDKFDRIRKYKQLKWEPDEQHPGDIRKVYGIVPL